MLLQPVLGDSDPFISGAAVSAFPRSAVTAVTWTDVTPRQRPWNDAVLRRSGDASVTNYKGASLGRGSLLAKFLHDADPEIRRTAIQWVAEKGLQDYAETGRRRSCATSGVARAFEAWLAAKELLANPGNAEESQQRTRRRCFCAQSHCRCHSSRPSSALLALRMLPPEHAKLKLADLLALVKDADPELRAEAVKTLTWRSAPAAQQALRGLASDEALPLALRGDAVLGLALSAPNDAETRQLLLKLLKDGNLAQGALRSLRRRSRRLTEWSSAHGGKHSRLLPTTARTLPSRSC